MRERKIRDGWKWLQPIQIPEALARSFASRCAGEGKEKRDVIVVLITWYAEGKIDVNQPKKKTKP